MRSIHPRSIVLMIFVLGLLIAATGCSQESAQQEAATPTPLPTPIVPVKPVYTVQVGEVTELLQFTGRVAPVQEQELFFKSSGRVRNIYTEKDDEVTAGQVLADLEVLDDLERQRQADELNARRAEILVENAQLSLTSFELNAPNPELLQAQALQAVAEAEKAVEEAERAYRVTQSTAGQADIDAAHAQVILANKALEDAQERFEPYADKPDDNLIKANLQSALSAAQRNYDAAVRRYNALTGTSSPVEQSLAAANLTLAQAQLAQAQWELEQLEVYPLGRGYEQELALMQNQVELAQIAFDEITLGIQDLEDTIADAQIVAPFDGQVLSFNLREGQEVEAYKPRVVVGNTQENEISADLDSDEMEKLEEGMQVSVALVNRPGETVTGVIRRLPYPYGGGAAQGEVEEDQSVRISLDVSTGEVGFEMGDLVRVTVVLEHKENVLWLPPQAIRTFEGRKFVVVQDAEYQQRVDVKIGIQGEDRIEILEGLTEGQEVIGQ